MAIKKHDMKKKPHVVIFSGYGLNTEDETKAAFESVGATADIIHINDVIARPALLQKAQILVVPGGFSYGDDTGSGKAYGNRLKQHLGTEIEKFLAAEDLWKQPPAESIKRIKGWWEENHVRLKWDKWSYKYRD